MKNRTPEEIREKVYLRHWRPREVSLAIEKLGGEVVFDALYGIFLDEEKGIRNFQEQEIAGRMLYELLPKTSKPLKLLVRNCLNNWNYSVEELPFYFREVFGKCALESTVNQIEKDGDLNEYEKGALKVFRRWCGLEDIA